MPDKNPLYNTSGPRAITKEDKDAMNAMMKARLAYAEMHGNPAAKRMVAPTDNPYIFDDGDTGTHHIASYGKYAIPGIQDVNGTLEYTGPRIDEAIKFDREEDAEYFAKNYKRISPALRNGGAMAPNIPTWDYPSKGTPIYRDTTDAPPKKYDKGGLIRKLGRITNSTKKFNNGGGTDNSTYSVYDFWKNRTQPYDKFGNVNPDYKGTNKIAQLKQLFSQPLGQNMSPKSTQSDDKQKKDWLNPKYTVQNSYSDDGNTYTELITDRENDSFQYKRVKDTNTGEIKYFAKDTRVKNSPWKIKEEGTRGYRAVSNLFGEDKTGYATSDERVDFINKELTKRAQEKEDLRIRGLSSEDYAKELSSMFSFGDEKKETGSQQYASIYDAVLAYDDGKNLQDYVDAFQKGESIELPENYVPQTINTSNQPESPPKRLVFGEPGFQEQQQALNEGRLPAADAKYSEKLNQNYVNRMSKELINKIINSNMSNLDKRALLQDQKKLNELIIDYESWSSSGPGGINPTSNYKYGKVKSEDFIINEDGNSIFQLGRDPVLIDGPVDMLDKEWIQGVVGGKAFSDLLGGTAGMIASKFKANPIVQATSSSLSKPFIQNISPKFAQSFPVLNKAVTANNLMTVGFGVPAVTQYFDPNSKSRQIVSRYQNKGDNLSEVIYDTSMNALMASPLLAQGLGGLYKGLAGGINVLKSSPYVRDFKGGWSAYQSGEAKLGDLFKKEKIIRFNYSPTKYKFDPTDPTKGLFFQSSRNPDLASYLKGAKNQQEFYTTLANAKNYNLASQQSRLRQGLNVGGGSQMKGYGNFKDWQNWVNLSTERSIAGSKSAEMQNALSNLSKTESPKTMAELRTLINNPENYWKMKEATPYNLNLIKNLPANKYEYLLSPNMASNLSPTKVGNYESSLFDLWGKTYLQGQGYRTKLANQFNKAFTRYKPTLTRAKFTGEGGSAVESNVFQQDE